jgi:hypothetical protein
MYNQLESQRNTLGEAEERLTRMGKELFFFCILLLKLLLSFISFSKG